MASTILPGNQNTVLPVSPTDGQIFIDAERVRWVFNANSDLWEKTGTIDELPRADANTIGLMTAQDKSLLDRVPVVGGGFGLIVDTKLLLQSPTNPDGVIRGDIELRSESLDISCVGADRVVLKCPHPPVMDCTTSGNVPALMFSLSQKFLDTFIINRPGPEGKKGFKGLTGDQGNPGFSPGPVGEAGITGQNITELCHLVSIDYRDVDGLTDTGIVNLQLLDNDGHGCKMIITKSKLNVPDNAPADAVVATPLQRAVIYDTDSDPAKCEITRLDEWKLIKSVPDDFSTNVYLLRLPKGSNKQIDSPVHLNATMPLSQFVSDVVAEYMSRLQKLDTQWGQQVKTYIEGIDDQARTILSELANELSLCEFNLPAVEYCITFNNCANPPPSPSAAAAARAGHDVNALTGQSITNVRMGRKDWRVTL